jgi:hypothetical protein
LKFDLCAFLVSFDPSVDVGVERNQESIGLILKEDFDPLRIVFVIEEVDIFFDQFDGGFIDFTVQGDGSIAIHFSAGPDAEEVPEIFGSGPQEVEVLGVTIPGGFFGRAMDGSMIGLVTPLFEPFVEFCQG